MAQDGILFTPAAVSVGSALTADQLYTLIAMRRYEPLRIDPKRPARASVRIEAISTLYRIFNGNLRGTFAALDDATDELLGLGASGPEAPLSLEDMAPFLTRWYA